ncbi:PQQ-dependent sugar dehydrogenase [Jeotgalibacillus soli]|uniref:Quinoprotein glucose dehydrogenase n=1 Tax=Jeotgalibacillus soli TaxID=889306 RepID=A0A0C2W0F4_9BACL|nr:PQQ-dependent sugar dehydrogenase [Jeotgalibacillus soli]KIL49668.1 quinoprotein glucose dehydrogenase [Jeotgalibacillus soli]
MLAAVLLLAACQPQNEQESVAGPVFQEADSQIQAEVVAKNLDIPWSIDFFGDVIFLSERNGSIVMVDGDITTRQDIQFEKELSRAAEAGLLGFVLHPDFSSNRQAFAYYTYIEGGVDYNRVVSLEQLEGKWFERNIILDHIETGNVHHGGRLAISPDQKLFVTIGDAAVPELAQDMDSLSGKILRFNLDGTIPEDNPFEGSPVYSTGHRNPQGLAWTEAGELIATEHGASAKDEINRIRAGANYGWPLIEGDEQREGLESPFVHSGASTWAPSGAAVYNQELIFATLRGESVKSVNLETGEIASLIEVYGRIRDVKVRNGELYFATNNRDGRGNPSSVDDQLVRVRLP